MNDTTLRSERSEAVTGRVPFPYLCQALRYPARGKVAIWTAVACESTSLRAIVSVSPSPALASRGIVRQPDMKDLLDLVGLVYEGAVSPGGWRPLVERTTHILHGTATVLFVHDMRGSVEFSTSWGLPDDAMEQYARDFAPIDVARDTVLAGPPGRVVTEESVPPEIYRRSAILNEWRAPWDVARNIGYDVYRDERRLAGFAVQASARRQPFGAEDAALFERLLPHLRRAIAMNVHLGRLDAVRSGLEDVIDGLAVGVVLLDESSKVVFTNAAAARIMRRRDGLSICGGRLRAHLGDDDRALSKTIADAIETSSRGSIEGGGTLVVRRAQHAPPYSLLVNPGPGAGARSLLRTSAAIVLIGDPDAEIVSDERVAARLYGLTPSEARLAVAVASGASLSAYAAEREIAVSTVRWTMKQVLAKTGLRRQAELVRLLLTGPAATGAGRSRDD